MTTARFLHIVAWAFIVAWVYGVVVSAQTDAAIPLAPSENAYNAIPAPDGKRIAFVRTGWGRGGGTVGFGRSNLRSEVMLMNASGELLSSTPLADTFLAGWTSDGASLLCYRDGDVLVVTPEGEVTRRLRLPHNTSGTEHAAYLPSRQLFVWMDSQNRQLQSSDGPLAELPAWRLGLIVPSPDERYIAIAANGASLWVFDTIERTWAHLGRIVIHPDTNWDYVKPSWDPWLHDSSQLIFIQDSALVLASPDGARRTVLIHSVQHGGLAVASPNGKEIAFATFEPRTREVREDLTFWGATLWVVDVAEGASPRRMAQSTDTTYTLRWLGDTKLIFDRIADEAFYRKARLWSVKVP